ncbi:MAG: hypothetical protein AMXMBFR6_08400 [Betaproteobacteria bacterium]
MDRQTLSQLFGSLFWLMLIFALLGASWAVGPMTVSALAWLTLWLTRPGAIVGLLMGLIALLTGR